MKTKNKVSIAIMITTVIIASLGVYLYFGNQTSTVTKTRTKDQSRTVLLKQQQISEVLGDVSPVRIYFTAQFSENNSLINDGTWVQKNQKISNTGIYSPIQGIFSIKNNTPKIYYPESQFVFYVSENEISDIYPGMPIKFNLVYNSMIQGETKVKSISFTAANKGNSVAKYKITSDVLNQNQLNLQKVRFGQHVSIRPISNNLVLPHEMLKKDNIITVKLLNKWQNVHVNVERIDNNNVIISPQDGLKSGLEVKK